MGGELTCECYANIPVDRPASAAAGGGPRTHHLLMQTLAATFNASLRLTIMSSQYSRLRLYFVRRSHTLSHARISKSGGYGFSVELPCSSYHGASSERYCG